MEATATNGRLARGNWLLWAAGARWLSGVRAGRPSTAYIRTATATASAMNITGSGLRRAVTSAVSRAPSLWERYMSALQTDPLKTKGLTSGFVKIISKITAASLDNNAGSLTVRRLLGVFIFGLCIDTPMCHYWFSHGLPYLADKVINATVTAKAPSFVKTFIAVVVSAFSFDMAYIFTYGVTCGLLTGEYDSLDAAISDAAGWIVPVWKDSLKVWPTFTFMSMYLLPEPLVVPASNVIGYFWNTYVMLSSQKKEKQRKEEGKSV